MAHEPGSARGPIAFGVECEQEYLGHLTPAQHVVRLRDLRSPHAVAGAHRYASADEVHIRVWGPAGDIAKASFPGSRRSMVSAMAVCPAFSAIVTTEVDMTLKVYSDDTLEVLEVFSFEQSRKQAGLEVQKGPRGEKAPPNEKITALATLPQRSLVLVGGENGCELWKLTKSEKKRASTATRLEHHLQLQPMGNATTDAVLGIATFPGEGRVLCWGPGSLHVLDMELRVLATCDRPHPEAVSCASIHVVSELDTAILTGGAEGMVKYWTIRGSAGGGHGEPEASAADASGLQAPPEALPEERLATVRLEHSYSGHGRQVEMVCFYAKTEEGVRDSLCVSAGRDGKLRIWSLEQFCLVYTLDLQQLDARAKCVPLGPNFLAISAVSNAEASAQRAQLSLLRFTAHLGAPYATTSESPVVVIAHPPRALETGPAEAAPEAATATGLQDDTAVLVSEDMAVRVMDSRSARLIATLPPPPNSKVQVLGASICPVWQLLILWLSSQEVGVFFVPSAAPDGEPGGDGGAAEPSPRAKSSTPLLIRRFSIYEVRTAAQDKDLCREAFSSLALHHGPPPQELDSMGGHKVGTQASEPRVEAEAERPDWFLIIGTHSGTLQAFGLGRMLATLPIWGRLASHLPSGVWDAQAYASPPSRKKMPRSGDDETPESEGPPRPPQQRPFPRGAADVWLRGRWKYHDHPIAVLESLGDRLLTVDTKRRVQIFDVASMECVFQVTLEAYTCFACYALPQARLEALGRPWSSAAASPFRLPSRAASATPHGEEEAAALRPGADAGGGADAAQAAEVGAAAPGPTVSWDGPLCLAGVVVGVKSGGLQLVLTVDGPEKEGGLLQSHASHIGPVIQVDFCHPLDCFASAGQDGAVKLWSRGLALLRDVVFPQPLTAVAFRRVLSMDCGSGHGDILVGFAAHVERVPYAVWSRGLGLEGARTRSLSSSRADADLSAQAESDDISQLRHLYDPSRLQTPATAASPGPEDPEAAGRVLSEDEDDAMADALARARLNGGFVQDFRGQPLYPLGRLSGRPADLEEAARPKDLPKHERSAYLDQSDFRAITRRDTGYYDYLVQPSTLVDAPRNQAFRGVCEDGGRAVVHSLGLGHLRGEDELKDEVPDAAQELEDGAAAVFVPKALARNLREPRRPFSLPARASEKEEPPQPPSTAQAPAPPPSGPPESAPEKPAPHPPLAPRGDRPSRSLRAPAPPSASPAPEPPPSPKRSAAATSVVQAQPAAAGSPPPGPRARAATGLSSRVSEASAAGPPVTKRRTERMERTRTERSERAERRSARTPEVGREPTMGRDAEEQERATTKSPGADSEAVQGRAEVPDTMDEPWRDRRVARIAPWGLGHGTEKPRPLAQDVANTELDGARMLQERGVLVEAPAEVEENLLKALAATKSDWLYYPPGSEAESSHRQVVQASAAVVESKPKQMWTSTGRLMIGTTPRRALPESLVARKMASPRPPMTREEVTQLQLIEAAKAPPRQRLPDMAVRLASPRLASPRPGGGEEERATQRRVLVPKSGGRPLSARSGGSGAQRLSWAAPLPADSRDAGLEAEAVSSWRPAARPETRPAPLSAR